MKTMETSSRVLLISSIAIGLLSVIVGILIYVVRAFPLQSSWAWLVFFIVLTVITLALAVVQIFSKVKAARTEKSMLPLTPEQPIIARLKEREQQLGESLNVSEQRANNAQRRAQAAEARANAAERRADAAEARASAAERRADNLQRQIDRLRSGR